MSLKLFIDIHSQVDFCVKSGRMQMMNQATLDSCEDLVNYAVKNNLLIAGSVETNDFTKRYCIKGEMGWLKTNETSVKRSIFVPNVKLSELEKANIIKPKVQGIYFETTRAENGRNTLFSNPNALALLESVLDMDTEFVVFGTNFEDALFNTVEDLIVLASKDPINLSIAVVSDACAFDGEEIKLSRMNALGSLSQKFNVPIRFATVAKITNE